ncbi:MAG: hypothetical protein LBD58_00230 [Treponema sp.]|jgi:hypothetical protein|nr:hypothetical protein [Treponema sp.]
MREARQTARMRICTRQCQEKGGDEIIAMSTRTTSKINVMLSLRESIVSVANAKNLLTFLVVFSITVCIMAQALSSSTSCIIIWGWWDLILTLTPCIIIFCYLFFLEKIPDKHDTFLNIVFLALSIGSALISFIVNIQRSGILGLLFATVSFFTKIIMVVLAPIIVVLYISSLRSDTPDKRSKD